MGLCRTLETVFYFYPRSPCGERPVVLSQSYPVSYFYPRSPCGERPAPCISLLCGGNFYPRSPCGERQRERHFLCGTSKFLSTLSLRRATSPCMIWSNIFLFLSTLSLRRATNTADKEARKRLISIHALLAESDLIALFDFPVVPVISIHALLAESDPLR